MLKIEKGFGSRPPGRLCLADPLTAESSSYDCLGREESGAEVRSHDHTSEKASWTELKIWIKDPEKNDASEGPDNFFAPLRVAGSRTEGGRSRQEEPEDGDRSRERKKHMAGAE